ncbi:lambda exonuclease family protein [Stenotrophomonas acidaminiphila]|uniref:lambda exonuclease family protein n=1 Tax=Stenotrophomonas acidaminiphila TaxID=128780 RepID=UPI0024ACB699|nr:lambda exonuclease family protein [Stenotrophomonas acidaminiphila]WHL17671.1 YqaJ viral recombinase family protein [Stenotrophomonas acidaminiphila]
MQILTFEQRSPEWYAARRGVPTASEFGNIITPKKGEYAAAADTYINQLIDELMRPDAGQAFTGNRHTERGELLEDDARELYAFENELAPQQVGFILNDAGTLGCSPDSLIGEDGGLEIKCPDGPTHVKWVRAGGIPDEHKPQVHGSLIITGRAWWDFLSYCPGYEPLLVRVTPDGFTEKLQGHLDRFLREYHAARARFLSEAA